MTAESLTPETVHCAGCTGADYLGRSCRGRVIARTADPGGLRATMDLLDVIDGIVDETHPEGDGCPLCVALDDLRAALAPDATAPETKP
jgi:hypothetical protein